MIRYQINLINEKKEKDLERFNYDIKEGIISGEEALIYFSKDHIKKYALACAFCVKRSFLLENDIRFPRDARLHEDLATWPIAIANAKSIAILNYRGYNYYRNDDSLTRNIDRITDKNEYIAKIFSNQQEFLQAIQIAILGVWEANISSKAKDACIEDLYARLDIYNISMNEKHRLLNISKMFENEIHQGEE